MVSFRDWLDQHESSPTTRALNTPWAYPALYVGGNPYKNYYNPKMISNYEDMIKRDTKKKKKKKHKHKKTNEAHSPSAKKRHRAPSPDRRIDNFAREADALKQVVQIAAQIHKKQKPTTTEPKPEAKPKRVSIDDDLKKVAKMALLHLKSAPEFYKRQERIDDLVGREKETLLKKVSRQDASQIARELGVDFGKTKFTPETFRRGIESELHRSSKPSLFDRASRGTDPE